MQLMDAIERAAQSRVEEYAYRVGVFGIIGADDAMITDAALISRKGLERTEASPLAIGDQVRDFCIDYEGFAWYPYDEHRELRPLQVAPMWHRFLWPMRTDLRNRATFSGGTYISDGRPWYEWHQLPKDPGASHWSIAFAEVATHNHFVLDRGGNIFKQTAPVVKLPEGATEDEHLALLGVLNSSTICFWLKQQCQEKPSNGVKRGYESEAWTVRYQFNGANVADIPIPSTLPIVYIDMLNSLAREAAMHEPSAVGVNQAPNAVELAKAEITSRIVRAQMIAVQEELDWEAYRLYGLIDEDVTYAGHDMPRLALGERAFEIALARKVQAGEEETAWFTRHGSTPITEIPPHWPLAYRDLVQRRLEIISSDPSIQLLEKPECKRRWLQDDWAKRQDRALQDWLLAKLEERRFWLDSQGRPLPRSIAQLADDVTRDADMVSVLALWEGRPDVPVTQSLVRLLADEAVPYLAAYRYKDPGLRKRKVWEETWRLQRREDAGEKIGPIAVPPKYAPADFRKNSYWQARGKLDVPKERFILYPDAGRETDPTPLLGWAGWDHAQQSLALSLIIGDREKDGWDDEQLVPLVAGLAELQPWVEQWHGEVDPDYGVSLAAFCREQLTARAAQVGKTLDELAAWRPAPATRGRRARRAE
jgi:hypothetical protein